MRLLGSGPLWGAPSRETVLDGGIGVRIGDTFGGKLATEAFRLLLLRADIDDPALVLAISLKDGPFY